MERILIGAMGTGNFSDTEYRFQSGQTDISNFLSTLLLHRLIPTK